MLSCWGSRGEGVVCQGCRFYVNIVSKELNNKTGLNEENDDEKLGMPHLIGVTDPIQLT